MDLDIIPQEIFPRRYPRFTMYPDTDQNEIITSANEHTDHPDTTYGTKFRPSILSTMRRVKCATNYSDESNDANHTY